MATIEIDLPALVAGFLRVRPEQVNGTVYPETSALKVVVSDDTVPLKQIHELAIDLGGTVVDADVERIGGHTIFTVQNSSVIKRRYAKP